MGPDPASLVYLCRRDVWAQDADAGGPCAGADGGSTMQTRAAGPAGPPGAGRGGLAPRRALGGSAARARLDFPLPPSRAASRTVLLF